ncbi:MAG TPA: hypothetical protein V6C86_26020, partial [Oculatellaceae cyanobacterium]
GIVSALTGDNRDFSYKFWQTLGTAQDKPIKSTRHSQNLFAPDTRQHNCDAVSFSPEDLVILIVNARAGDFFSFTQVIF